MYTDAQNGLQRGRRRSKTGGVPSGYPQGYVEDVDEPRTKLEAVFSVLLILADFGFGIHLIRG